MLVSASAAAGYLPIPRQRTDDEVEFDFEAAPGAGTRNLGWPAHSRGRIAEGAEALQNRLSESGCTLFIDIRNMINGANC
jgi:hypothetical protein